MEQPTKSMCQHRIKKSQKAIAIKILFFSENREKKQKDNCSLSCVIKKMRM